MVIPHCRIPGAWPARTWPVLLALLLALGAPLARAAAGPDLEAPRYVLGRGLHLPALDLTLAGYTSLRVRGLEGRDTRFDLHDLALFLIWQPAPRWTLFAEIEGEELATVDGRGLNNGDSELVVERAYVDFAATPRLNLRAGRFLTPFGRWNLVHADPLVWTVTRPLMTTVPVPDHASGVLAWGSLPLAAGNLEYSAYLDGSESLDPVHGEAEFEEVHLPAIANDFDHAAGGQLRYHFLDEAAQIGVSYAAFDIDRGRGHHHAFGADGLYRWHRWEVSGEAVYRLNSAAGTRDDWGAFGQLVVPLHGPLYGVGRLEYYSSGVLGEDVGRGSLGLALRPVPPVTIKVEYHDGNNHRVLPDGWEVSCGILF
ncbi:MAG: hypothetical protein KDK06_08060 [Gammaproteobacteria bacterium]|nr:hypothetical protein [Gammaproteobacteria bacterium]